MRYFEYLVRTKFKTVRAFCRESGLDQSNVYSYMSGRRFPSVPTFMLFADLFDISAEELWKNWYKDFTLTEGEQNDHAEGTI